MFAMTLFASRSSFESASIFRIISFTSFCLWNPSCALSESMLNELTIFSTVLFTESMLPIISSTAPVACATPSACSEIIFSRESMLDAIWFTVAEVSFMPMVCS